MHELLTYWCQTTSFVMTKYYKYHYKVPLDWYQITFLWLLKPLFLLCVYKNVQYNKVSINEYFKVLLYRRRIECGYNTQSANLI